VRFQASLSSSASADTFSGESGLGKSTLVNTLFNTTLYPPKEPLPPAAERPKTVAIESIGAGMLPSLVVPVALAQPSFRT